MNLSRSLVIRFRYTTKESLKTLTASLVVLSLVATSAIAYQNLTTYQASALTPPDTCFAFDSGTGTITDYYNNEDNNGANPACPRNVDIPATIGGTSVTAVGPSAFLEKGLITLTIPNSVTNIGFNAFSLNQLTSVTIPNSVTNIGSGAFSHNQLTSVTVLNSSATMYHDNFSVNPIASMTIGSNTYSPQTPTIDPACFDITGLNVNTYYQFSPLIAQSNGVLCGGSVSIPNSVTSIGDYAFRGFHLTSVTIPNSVTSIGNRALAYNHLTSVTIPNSVTSIGDRAFLHNRLTSVTIPNSVTSIDDRTFAYNHLTSVTIPNSVTSIGSDAFGYQSADAPQLEDDMISSDLTRTRIGLDSIWYTRLYTADPSNPNGLQDQVNFEMFDFDGDSNFDDFANVGGHIINPTSATLSFKDKDGTELQPSRIFTGKLEDSTDLHNYFVSQGPVVPAPVDLYATTPIEIQAMRDALDVYYRIGDVFTYTAPLIDGVAPTPAHYNFVLGASAEYNNQNFVYSVANEELTPETPGVSVPVASHSFAAVGQVRELSNTGLSIWVTVVCAGLLLILSIVAILKPRQY